MSKFVIEPHFRLQEWVAEEKGYFRAEGLDYEFREFIRASGGAHHVKGDKVGAFQSIEEGRSSNVTCACHWTVNVPTSRGYRSRSATNREATTRPSRRSSNTCPPIRSTCRSRKACCLAAWRLSSTARRPPARSSAAPTTSPSSWASARSSTTRS